MSKFQSFLHPRQFIICVLCTVILSTAFSKDPNAKCTQNRLGLPACNFNNGRCFSEIVKDGDTPAWTNIGADDDGPVVPYEGAYMFLDHTKSNSKARRLEAAMDLNGTAICAKFYYATSGSVATPISFYLRENATVTLMHELQANTHGQWKSSEFFCCLPNSQSDQYLGIEATSTQDSQVAVDYIDLRNSDMPCENNRLECYPRPASQIPLELDDDESRACPDVEETGARSCEFTGRFKDSPDLCGWTGSSGWEGRQKFDGSGVYDVIYTNRDKGDWLTSDIADNVTSLCIEIQFAVDVTENTDLTNVFSLHILKHNKDTEGDLWSQAFNYDEMNAAEWKLNSFSGCLPAGNNRQIQLISNKKGLGIDYIHMRKSNENCAIPEPTEQLPTTTTTSKASAISEKSPHSDVILGSSEGFGDLETAQQQRPNRKEGPNKNRGGDNTGVIAGTIVTALVVVAVAGGATCFYLRRRITHTAKIQFFKAPTPIINKPTSFENAMFGSQ